ncbi:Putative fusarinine C esterase SidJ, alpha/Beta hydrolase [Septoria linicola]|uniref:Fusarinine C esterase SidJ, alpha/Beta hydrolase n=1 Tax=Septoria linicola TaxID=215465 RepID=A0A9Q9EQN2_9PEZI|nr:Putative fusarinine C esterase SidJ, alpha/Beta hydrolase [Septoria linicola]
MELSSSTPATSTPGILHYVPNNLSAFEPSKPLASGKSVNTLLWIGGMFDTPGQVAYPFTIAQALGPDWSLLTASLSSSGYSWGTTSIAKDAEDVARIIAYIKERRPGGKLVIAGHSTGCQDCMEYTIGEGAEKRPAVDGVILQAPVSDREAIENELPKDVKHNIDQTALKMCRENQARDVLPNKLTKNVFGGRLAISAKRWVDVSSPGPAHSGSDDFFSSDLPDERLKSTFGKLPSRTPLLILYSGSDESVPATVDKEKLVQRWTSAVKEGGGVVDQASGVVKGATHNYNGNPEDVVQDMVKRVLEFTGRIGSAGGSSRI